MTSVAVASAAKSGGKSANCGRDAGWQQGGIARSYGDSWSQVQPDFDKLYFSHYTNCISLTISTVFLSLCQLHFCHMYRAALEGHSETVGEPGVNSGETLPSLRKVWRKTVATWMLQKEVIKMRCTMQDLGRLHCSYKGCSFFFVTIFNVSW